MKKLTINDIKDILRTELEKSKRHVQHYYLGTNRFSETDRLKSILNNIEIKISSIFKFSISLLKWL